MIKNVYDVIELIRRKPAMYLGTRSVTKLKAFLDGYRFAVLLSNDSEYEDRLIPLPFSFFYDFVAKKFNDACNTGWCDIILRQVKYNESDGLELFFELLDKYKEIAITQCLRAELSGENINWLRNESIKYQYRLSDDTLKGDTKIPIYNDNVIAVYKLGLSEENSWILAVEDKCSLLLNWYNNEAELINFANTMFGRLNWKAVETESVSLIEKTLYRG